MGRPTKLSDQNKAWFKKSLPKRAFQIRPRRQRILIVCEGEKTEPNYFKSIQITLPRHIADVVDIIGLGDNTQSLVNRAKEICEAEKYSHRPYDEAWVVFDRDSFEPEKFDNAIQSALSSKIQVAWSNEAFELWYLLHFEDRCTGMCRNEYKVRLTHHLCETYQKKDPNMYKKLAAKGNEAQAIKRAKRRQAEHFGIPPSKSNPCTKVNELVERLNEFKQLRGQ